ncbi:MAG: hypothetical protein ACRDJE_20145 [Dehalococcoidia bacterium]
MLATAVARTTHGQSPWIRSQAWDSTFLIFSSVLVSVPLIAYYWLHVPTQAVNYVIAGLIGGPHLYATFTLTFWEPSSWKNRPLYTASALAIPVIVIYLAVANLSLLMTIFLAWASFHVLQQLAFLSDCYRSRGGEPLTMSRSRVLDYAVIFGSLYPIAMYKLANDRFRVGKDAIYEYFPALLKTDLFIALVWSGFFIVLGLWLAKTVQEYREGRLNYPKTLLIGITACVSFIIPAFDNLDVAFQGMNTWHSFQYIALLWFVNSQRKAHGQISSRLVRSIAGPDHTRRFYLFHVGLTLAAGASIFVLYAISRSLTWGLEFQQCYFMVVLSFLLMHYYFDTLMFARPELVLSEFETLLPRRRSPLTAAGVVGA